MATATLLTALDDTSNTNVYTTASISPTASTLLVVAITGNGSGFGDPTVTGLSLTWTRVNSSFTASLYSGLYAAKAGASPGSGAVTVDFGAGSMTGVSAHVVQFGGVDVSGTTANAFVQSAVNNDSSVTSITVTLAAFGSGSNPTFGWAGVGQTTTAITAGSGFTQISHGTRSSPAYTTTTQFRNSNDTTVDFDWAPTAGNPRAGAVELRATTVQTISAPARLGVAALQSPTVVGTLAVAPARLGTATLPAPSLVPSTPITITARLGGASLLAPTLAGVAVPGSQPVATITLGGTDISAYIHGGAKWGRGANFDGTNEAAGWSVVFVKNNDRRFSPYNGSSPLASVLKIGKLLRITATYGAVTYYLFEGYLRRIVENPSEGTAELHAQDALGRYSRQETAVSASYTRTLTEYRTAILDNIDATATRTMGTGTAEQQVPFTGSGSANPLELLGDINTATGSVHFITAVSGGHRYKVVTRTELQAVASVETFDDTDLATPFAESLDGTDYNDEGVINFMRVNATPRLLVDSDVVWESRELPLTVDPLAELIIWANFGDPTFVPALSYTATGNPTVNAFYFSEAARIVITAGVTAAVFTELTITGEAAPVADLQSMERYDTSSIADFGIMRGELTSDLLSATAHAQALVDWYLYRYKQPKARPVMTNVNRFPSQLTRDVADRVTVTATVIGASAKQFWIRGFTTSITESGAVWRTEYDLEEAPALVNAVTLGGTSDQGIGGTAILGY